MYYDISMRVCVFLPCLTELGMLASGRMWCTLQKDLALRQGTKFGTWSKKTKLHRHRLQQAVHVFVIKAHHGGEHNTRCYGEPLSINWPLQCSPLSSSWSQTQHFRRSTSLTWRCKEARSQVHHGSSPWACVHRHGIVSSCMLRSFFTGKSTSFYNMQRDWKFLHFCNLITFNEQSMKQVTTFFCPFSLVECQSWRLSTLW